MSNQSEQVNELFSALARAQAKLTGAKKDSENPYFKSTYANLESVWEACRPVLYAHGLCVVQTTDIVNNEPVIVTTLGHSSGQWIRGTLPLTMVKKDPQSQGSAISYARRYALAAIVGVVQTDDDGESAMDRGPQGKGMIGPGNGIQHEGPRLPTLLKDCTEKIGCNPSGKLVESLDMKTTHALIDYLENKYKGTEMPNKTADIHDHLIGHAMKLEGLTNV
jgi:ERF superfamily